MNKLFWFLVLIVGIALGGVSVWYFTNAESPGGQKSQQPTLERPRLIPEPAKADSSHIPRGEITDKTIEEGTEAQQLPEEPLPIDVDKSLQLNTAVKIVGGTVETAGQVVETVIETSVQTTGGMAEVAAETAMEVIEVPGAVVQGVTNLIDPRPAIAVLPFKVMGDTFNFNEDTGDILCDAFVSEIDSQQYQIYERGQLASLLEEKGFQASLLVDNTTSAAKFGRLAKVQYLVLGSLAKLGGQYQLSARVVDCTTGRLGKRGWVVFDSMRQYPDKVPELVNLLGLRSGTEYGVLDDMDNDLIGTINPDADFQVQIRTAENKQTYLEDEYIKFVVTAEKDCFITLITVDSAGEMTLLLPNKWQRRAFVRRGTSITIPTDEMEFRFPIQPPHGQTLVKAIATLQPLKLSGVNTKSIDEGFVTLEKGVKAIGIEAIDGGDLGESISAGGIADLLKARQWATDELMVITAKEKAEKPNLNQEKLSPENTGTPFDFDYVGDDINEKIAHRYRQLTRDTLEPSQIILHRSPELADSTMVDEYLIFQQGSCDFIKVKASQIGQYENDIVVPNIKLYSFGLPTTRLAEVQWALDNRFGKGKDLGIAQRYDELIKHPTRLIGLVDGPVDWQDPRISHAAWTNTGEIENNGIDDDRNGFVDDIHGWNFRDNTNQLCSNPYQFNHGTALVSVMAAKPIGTDQDVLGIAPQAKIITAVVLADAGDAGDADNWLLSGSLEHVINAIDYVTNCGAKVINCSFGTRVNSDQLEMLSRIPLWDKLARKGVVLICAAGNNNIDIDNTPVFPACLPNNNIIAVGATDAEGRPGRYFDTAQKKWRPFTNFGENTVDTKAPGTLILVGGQRGKTSLLNGTSYSAAMVSTLKSFE